MLLLKLTLVPTFLYLLSQLARHYGPRLAGWMAGLPVVAGPILWLLAQEHGNAFATQAARQAIAAIAASELFNLLYARSASRQRWPLALATALGGWLLAAWLLQQGMLSTTEALIVAGLAVLINSFALPSPTPASVPAGHGGTLWLRMLAAALLTLLVSQAAVWLGAGWSGVLAVFPLLAVVMAVSTQRTQGTAAVQALLRGMLLGRLSFASFCLALVLALPQLDSNAAFLLAILLSLLMQWLSRHWLPA